MSWNMFKNVYKYDEWKRSEHLAVRNTVGWYYWTHQLVEVVGEDAAAFLDGIYANPVANLKPSRARYTTMLNEDGQIIDDVVVFRMEENKFWVSTLYATKLMRWLEAHKGEARVSWENITSQWDMYAIQGPNAKKMTAALVDESIEEQKFFQILDNKVGEIPVKVNRGGFTGEKLGYEIYVHPSCAKALEEKIKEAGQKFDAKEVEEFQVMTLSLPTEKGFYLMCDIMWANPFEVGLDGGIRWDRPFIGRDALLKVKEEGAKRMLVGFVTDQDDIHLQSRERGGPGDPVMLNGEEVGRATKFTYSFVTEKSIGYALIDKSKAKIGDRVTINDNWATLTEKIFV